VLYDEKAANELRLALADTDIHVMSGMDGLLEAASMQEADIVLAAMSGTLGLRPALAAIMKKNALRLPIRNSCLRRRNCHGGG
jgi:1-deoxy-D-xylulose-5-phosphate reductoisomerase